MKRMARWQLVPAPVRKLIVAVVGGTVLLTGVVMIVAPGPATIVIPSGLAILSAEFVWARRLLSRCTSAAGKAGDLLRRKPRQPPD